MEKKPSFIGNLQFLGGNSFLRVFCFGRQLRGATFFQAKQTTHGDVGERFPLSLGSPQRTIWMGFLFDDYEPFL